MTNINKSASLFQRIGAFIIDMAIVTLISTILATPFIDVERISELNKEISSVVEQYEYEVISTSEYIIQSSYIYFDIYKEEIIINLITLALLLLYFVVYQFYNKGQTLGKKVFKIKLISEKEELTLNKILLRSVIINFIFMYFYGLLIGLFNNKDIFISYLAVSLIQYIIILIIVFMISIRKDRKGIHDILTKTRVISIKGEKNENI